MICRTLIQRSKEVTDSWYWPYNNTNEIVEKLFKNSTTKKRDFGWVWLAEIDLIRPKNARPTRTHGFPKVHKDFLNIPNLDLLLAPLEPATLF